MDHMLKKKLMGSVRTRFHLAMHNQPLKPISCLQLNLHHCIAATANLAATLCGNDFALLQEPWQSKGRVNGLNIRSHNLFYCKTNEKVRTCILFKNYIDAILLSLFSCSDLTVVRMKLVGGTSSGVVVSSAYMPHDSSTPPSINLLRELVDFCCDNRIPLITGAGANARTSHVLGQL